MEQFYINREKDLEEEKQFDISEVAKESGLLFTIYVTEYIWKGIIEPDEEATKRGEDEKTRTKEVLSELVSAIRLARQQGKTNIISFKASLTKEGKSQDFEIMSYLGPIGKENNNPCITLFTGQDIQN
mgnify:CR=1 FL=1